MNQLLLHLLQYKTVYVICDGSYVKELQIVDVDNFTLWCKGEIENGYCTYYSLNINQFNKSWFFNEEQAYRRL